MTADGRLKYITREAERTEDFAEYIEAVTAAAHCPAKHRTNSI